MKKYGTEDIPFVKDFVAGAVSAAIATTIMAPMDRVKLLLQVQASTKQITKEKTYKGMIDAFRRIPKEQGILSFWRGNIAGTARSTSSAGLSFTFHDFYQNKFLSGVDKDKRFWRYVAGNLAAGGAAGATTLTISYPVEFARTRLVVDIAKTRKERQYKTVLDCIVKTFHSDGIAGLYRGFRTSVQGIFIYRAAYFGIFDMVKVSFIDPDLIESKHQTNIIITFLLAELVTTMAALITYPFDTVRRRLMMQSGLGEKNMMYKNDLDCWIKIAKTEGIAGFYRGIGSNIILVTGSALVLVLYDEFKLLMTKKIR